MEEEEEEWPEAGSTELWRKLEQVPGQNQHFRSFVSINSSKDTKTALAQPIQNFKKVVTKQWDSMGAADTDVIALRTYQ